MSPDDDMPNTTSQYQSFSLANMVPQNSCNNEIIWKAIETLVRNYVLANGNVYVVTGPIFDFPTKTIGTHKILVPTRLFKAIYDPAKNAMIIVVTANDNVQTYQTITADDLQKTEQINVFPAVKNPSPLVLPPLPHLSGNCKKAS